MRRLLSFLCAYGLIFMLGSCYVVAAEHPGGPSDSQSAAKSLEPPVTPEADRSLEGDKKCTLCHNEASGHVLSIYQTKHGVKGDPRTPGCQGCHGESAEHQGNPTKSPDVVFGAKSKQLSSTEARTSACLSCHESGVHARMYWSGSAHEKQGVTCTDCHEMHNPEQKVLNKLTQPEVCFGCHQNERAQFHRFSRHPILEGKVSCTDCHNPHGSTGPRLMVKNTITETCLTQNPKTVPGGS